MVSSWKKSMKKVLKGSIIVIIIFITISMIATKLVYDFIFRRYTPPENAPTSTVAETAKSVLYTYPCQSHTLAGYLFKSTEAADTLIVFVPGFHAGKTQYQSQAERLTENGFDVFMFDCTGHGASGGKSAVGFPQIIIDLDATLDFIQNNRAFTYTDIVLFGHSRGGYAACCAVCTHPEISAVVSVNGVNSAMDGIMAYSVNALGTTAYINYPFLWCYQQILFGTELNNCSAVQSLSNTSTPTLIIQSTHDEYIPCENYSIYAYREKIKSDTVQYWLYENPMHNGHTAILYDANGMANDEFIQTVSAFFIQNTTSED